MFELLEKLRIRLRRFGIPAIALASLPLGIHDAHAGDFFWNRFGAGPTNTHNVLSGPAKFRVPDLDTEWQSINRPSITSQLVADAGVVYYGDFTGNVMARRIGDGAILWQTALSGGFGPNGPRVQSTPIVLPQHVYVTEYFSAKLFKLDRATGAILDETELATDPFHRATGSPVFTNFKGMQLIIQGLDADQNTPYLRNANGEVVYEDGIPVPLFTDNVTYPELGQQPFSAIGRVVAINANTGDKVWDVPVNAFDGEYGIGVWSTAGIDEKRGRIYVGTGQSYNPSPVDDSSGSANACAILGLDLADGSIEQVMSFKPTSMTPEESCVWSAAYPGGAGMMPADPNLPGLAGDTDVGSSPVLHSEHVGPHGELDLVTAMNKAGRIRSFNRDTGELVWERVLPTATGSIVGGPGVSYDNGVIFAPVLTDLTSTSRDTLNLVNGVNVGELIIRFLCATTGGQHPVCATTGVNTTTLVALDAATGQPIWARPEVVGHTFGALSISQGVVYHASFSGQVAAYDATNGNLLFSDNTPEIEPFPEFFPGFHINAPPANSLTLVDRSVFVGSGFGIAANDGSITKFSAPAP